MKESCQMLEQLDIPYEKKVVSAHRTPQLMYEFAKELETMAMMSLLQLVVVNTCQVWLLQ